MTMRDEISETYFHSWKSYREIEHEHNLMNFTDVFKIKYCAQNHVEPARLYVFRIFVP